MVEAPGAEANSQAVKAREAGIAMRRALQGWLKGHRGTEPLNCSNSGGNFLAQRIAAKARFLSAT